MTEIKAAGKGDADHYPGSNVYLLNVFTTPLSFIKPQTTVV